MVILFVLKENDRGKFVEISVVFLVFFNIIYWFWYVCDYLIWLCLKYIKVYMVIRWIIRYSLMLFWFVDFMNVIEEVIV